MGEANPFEFDGEMGHTAKRKSRVASAKPLHLQAGFWLIVAAGVGTLMLVTILLLLALASGSVPRQTEGKSTSAKSNPTVATPTVAIPTEPVDKVANKVPSEGDIVDRLEDADRQAMKLLMSGDKTAAANCWLAAVKQYRDKVPKDCTDDEALVVGVIYARIAFMVGKSAPKLGRDYIDVAFLYARKGRISQSNLSEWFERIGVEMKNASTDK